MKVVTMLFFVYNNFYFVCLLIIGDVNFFFFFFVLICLVRHRYTTSTEKHITLSIGAKKYNIERLNPQTEQN